MTATSAAFAQGFVNFAPGTYSVSTNSSISPLFGGTGTGGISGLTSATVGSFYYELVIQTYTGTTPTDLNVWDGTWKDGGLYDTNAPVAGRILNGASALNVGALIGWNAYSIGGSTFPNGTNYIMLVGWSANLGTTWLQASNSLATGTFNSLSFFGESTIGWENPNSMAPGNSLMGSAPNAGGQPIPIAGGMTLYELPIPEPATFALVGLGGLSLLWVRRRNG
jgi:hypothetical protein